MTDLGDIRPKSDVCRRDGPADPFEPLETVPRKIEPLERYSPPVSQRRLFYDLLWVPDVAVIVLVGVTSDFFYHLVFYHSTHHWQHGLLIGGISAVLYSAASVLTRRYTAAAVQSETRLLQMFESVLYPWIIAFGGVLLSVFLIKLLDDLSRGAFLTASVMSLVCLAAVRVAVTRLVHRLSRVGGFLNMRSLLIADGTSADELRHVENWADILVVETLHLPDFAPGDPHEDAVLAEVFSAARTRGIDQIILALPFERTHLINRLVDELTRLALPIRIYCSSSSRELLSNPVEMMGKVPTIDIRPHRQDGLEGLLKTVMDKVLAVAVLLAMSPVMAVIAVAIKLDSRGPVIFKQRRHGFAHNVFRIYKFRTMVTMDDGAEVKQAVRGDPRVTRVGAFLRRTSLDELPQFWNVLKGEMSIVGPRPHAVAHNLQHEARVRRYAARHNVKPGITGQAQISGLRGKTDSPEEMQARVEHDLWYIKHWSVWLDFKILVKTVFVVLSGKNAY